MNDPRLLTLLTLIKVKSYTKTAERLFITQPAVSQHIKSLEHQYDITIFDGTKGFNLTKQGEILIEYARRMQNQDIQLKEALFNSLNSASPLKIGITDFCKQLTAGNELFKLILDTYNHKVEIYIMNTDSIFADLETGKLDLGIIDSSFNDDLFEGVLLDTYSIVPFVSKEGKFKEIKRITREMLKNNPIVMASDTDGMAIATKESLSKSNILLTNNSIHKSNSLFLMKELINKFDGIGFMYNAFVDTFSSIKKMDLTNFKSNQNIYMVYSISSFEKNNFKKLINKVKKA